jgi:N-acetylglutamate synthase-like GNAT family acetyltransferase
MSAAAAPVRVVRPAPAASRNALVPASAGRGGPVEALRAESVSGKKATLKTATAADTDAIHALIEAQLADGHLLPRELGEIAVHAGRFVVALQGDRVVGCGELAPLSRSVAEVRSLVVDSGARNAGIGRRIVDELLQRATVAGFENLCAFTHTAGYFVRMGFSIVPHVWLPEKIVTDCHACPHFRRCGQYAVVHPLGRSRHSCVPLTALHG